MLQFDTRMKDPKSLFGNQIRNLTRDPLQILHLHFQGKPLGSELPE
jgi:hypothetical protein